MDNLPLVTVGIPTYNRLDGLKKTLNCMANQTYKNLEILVSDNCSPNPEIKEYLEAFAKQDTRLKFVIQQENITIVPNFVYLLKNATGEFFIWAADDDNWELNFIEVCVNGLLQNKDVVLAMTDTVLETVDGKTKESGLNRGFMQDSIYSRSYNFIKSNIGNKFFLCGVYRTEMVRNIHFDNSWGGEHLFLYEAIIRGKFLFVQNKSKFYYFLGGNSKSIESIKKAFNIKRRFAFIDAYVLRYIYYQFRISDIPLHKKIKLFFVNIAALIANEDHILYHNLFKTPLKRLIKSGQT